MARSAHGGDQPEFRWFFEEMVSLVESEYRRDRVAVRVCLLRAIANAIFPDVQHSEEAIYYSGR